MGKVTDHLAVDDSKVVRLRERFPRLAQPPTDDTCYASSNRPNAIAAIAGRCDLVLVVGSPTSSNSQRLVTVARRAGARAAHLVDDAGQLDPRWLEGAVTIGVTSGASAPEHIVRDLLDHLAAHGWSDVEQVDGAAEDIAFTAPPIVGAAP